MEETEPLEVGTPAPKVSRYTEKMTAESESSPETGHLSSPWPAENMEPERAGGAAASRE